MDKYSNRAIDNDIVSVIRNEVGNNNLIILSDYDIKFSSTHYMTEGAVSYTSVYENIFSDVIVDKLASYRSVVLDLAHNEISFQDI